MKRARIYCFSLVAILLAQGFPLLRIPIPAVIGLIFVAAGLVYLEVMVEVRRFDKDRARLEKLEETVEKAWNQLTKRMNAVENQSNMMRIGKDKR